MQFIFESSVMTMKEKGIKCYKLLSPERLSVLKTMKNEDIFSIKSTLLLNVCYFEMTHNYMLDLSYSLIHLC